jgi:tripartite-type tricarboxylate transporter receptor subunit TctC
MQRASSVSSAIATMAVLAASALPVQAQPYPAKPIRVIVPLAAGGGTDIAARVVGQKLTERWGAQVVVDNRPGAGGNIGAEIVAKATPDGYTALVTSPGPVVVNVSLMPKMPYDPARDLAPVAMLAATYYLLITHPSIPGTTVRELIQTAQARPGRLVLASGGLGAPSDLLGEMFKSLAKIDAVTVQYKGGGQALAEVVGGQASMMFVDMIAGLPHVNGGRARALATATAKRIPRIPQVPTLAESGIAYDATGWSGLFVPGKTPAAIVGRLNGAIREILKLPDVQERLAGDGTEFAPNTPQSLAELMRSDTAKYAAAVKVSGRRLE